MVAALASHADVIEVYGPITPEQEAVLNGLIIQASMKVRLAARAAGIDLDDLLQDDDLAVAAVRAAVVNAVVRVLRSLRNNPDGMRQVQRSQTAGPFAEQTSGTFDTSAAPVGGIYIDPADLPWAIGHGWVGSVRLKAGMT